MEILRSVPVRGLPTRAFSARVLRKMPAHWSHPSSTESGPPSPPFRFATRIFDLGKTIIWITLGGCLCAVG